ncbi:RSL1D1 isoform 6 [Pongo abelii]|uniref:RSL1D1 isoform 6 n=1 Tax=Pongo abelii TaxID=9601 RepID=A0A2J8R3P2_PONAB|nr:RSL1D1 isoform 6 [Pongo abelii]
MEGSASASLSSAAATATSTSTPAAPTARKQLDKEQDFQKNCQRSGRA